MRVLKVMKDGGPLSRVLGFFLIEWKRLFSVVVLRFSHGSREAYHTHAFNAVSWVLKGKLVEHLFDGSTVAYTPGLIPIITKRDCFHMVVSEGVSWALTFRGPWIDEWREFLPSEDKHLLLTHGRILQTA